MPGLPWLVLAVAYLLGSFPSAYLLARLFRGVDIRVTGSGNVGGMNALRNVGFWPGLLTGLLDVGKGSLAVYLAQRFTGNPGLSLLAGVGVVLGHNYMIWLGFKGGKGLGATAGALLVLSPLTVLYALLGLALVSLLLRDTNLGSGMGILLLPLILWLQKGEAGWVWMGLAIGLIVFSKHLGDLADYLKGRRQLF
ncbi:MAG: glycerol-3-phosphate acyltransferase [Firmicutes bacterium]|nr:glycerol-3-phosphate acyltransferase [Bacillota bacterium]MCL5040668.1 glycerol-3-phosphate acyltransferase [Bacillota bacterium]